MDRRRKGNQQNQQQQQGYWDPQQFQQQLQQQMHYNEQMLNEQMNQQMGQFEQNMRNYNQTMQQSEQNLQYHLQQQQQFNQNQLMNQQQQNQQYINYNYPPQQYPQQYPNHAYIQPNRNSNQQQTMKYNHHPKSNLIADKKEDNLILSNKRNEKINGQETQLLLESLFDKDVNLIQLCLSNQEELAKSLRKGKSNIKIELKKKYKVQLQFLKDNGFNNTRKVILLLKEEDGNEECVLRKLILKTLQEQSVKLKYEKEVQNLQQQFQYKKCNKEILQFLKETDGDQEKTLKLIERDQISKHQLEAIYKEQLKSIALEGWLNSCTKKAIIKILHKYEGNLEKAKFEIQMRCYHKIKSLTSSELKKLDDFNCSEYFGDQITDVVIDGNNLLFMNSEIRKNCINKQRNIAERKLCQLARNFKEITDINVVIAIFDQMYQEIQDTKISIINCKNTNFLNSDDFIVDYVSKLSNEQAKQTLIITSDQELTFRLISTNQNISVMKGKSYFKQIEELLSTELFNQIVQNNEI